MWGVTAIFGGYVAFSSNIRTITHLYSSKALYRPNCENQNSVDHKEEIKDLLKSAMNSKMTNKGQNS